LAVGNPLGLANTSTVGVVSAINRPVTATGQDSLQETITNAIQIDAAINPGNSGGPLFDASGRVIGVTSSIASLSSGMFGGQSGSIGLGFAIPINLAKSISAQLIESGQAVRPRLGVRLSSTTVTVDGVTRRGAQVEIVNDGTAAHVAGLRVGDVIVGYNGLPVAGSESLTAFVRESQVGSTVTMTVIREGRPMQVSAVLGIMDDDALAPVPTPDLPPEFLPEPDREPEPAFPQ
jgi:putative serine protease PepD